MAEFKGKGVTEVVSVSLLIGVAVASAGTYLSVQQSVSENIEDGYESKINFADDIELRVEKCYQEKGFTQIVLRNEADKHLNFSSVNTFINSKPVGVQLSKKIIPPHRAFTLNTTKSVNYEDDQILFSSPKTSQFYRCAKTERKDALSAAFKLNNSQPNPSDTVLFDASLSTENDGKIISYAWDWDNDENFESNGKEVTKEFSAQGEKSIVLRVMNEEGKIDKIRQTLTIGEKKPDNNIVLMDNSEKEIKVELIAYEGDTGIDECKIKWKDELSYTTTSYNITQSHSYSTYGDKSISYKCQEEDGDTVESSKLITLNSPISALFQVSPKNQPPNTEISFTDDSTGNIQTYEWNMGDGTVLNGQNPTHSYTSPGNYDVNLEVKSEGGETDTATKTVTVLSPPNADFTFNPTNPKPDELIEFTSQSSDEDGNIQSYDWSFGDGTTSTVQNPTHSYDNTGTEEVTLSVTDDDGLTDSTSKEIDIQSTPVITDIESPSSSEWQRTDFKVSVADSGSDNLNCRYRIDDGADGSWSSKASRDCNAENSFIITVGDSKDCSALGSQCKIETIASDENGNSDIDRKTFNIDYLSPSTSLSLNQGSDSSDLQIEAYISASSEHSKVKNCQIDWENDGSTDETININSGAYSNSLTHTYSSSGTYTAKISCTDVAGNLQTKTEDITVPGDTSLQYSILEDRTTEEVIDQDFINPQYKIDTNAEAVYFQLNGSEYQLFDDGAHSDEESGDQIYGITIESTELLGEKETDLRFTKNGEEAVKNTDNITFKRTPPSPSLSADFTESGAMIEAETNFGKKTLMGLNITVINNGDTRMQKYIEKECSGSCQKLFEITPQDGDEVTVKGNQSYLGLESDTTTAGTTFSSTANLKQADYLSNTGRNYTEESYWFSALFGISVEGFSEDNITDIYLTDENGDKIGEVKDIGHNVEGFLDLDPIEIARWNATVQPEEISGSSETVNVTVELDNGQTLTHELETLQMVEDNSPPSLDKFKPTSYLQNGNLTLDLIIDDNLQESASCDLYLNSTGEKLGSCSFSDTPGSALDEKVNISTPDGENFGFIKANISDNAGNYQTLVEGPFLLNPDTALTPLETHGDPRNKINLMIYGHKMSRSEAEDTANRNIDNFFSKDYLSYLDNYRSYFNWYLVDTDKEICSTIEGYDGTNCPNGREAISKIETYSDTLKNSRAGRIFLDNRKNNNGEWIRSVAYGEYTIISEQDSSSDPFSHELGHLIWRFNDEYGSNPGENDVFRDSYFFPDSMNNETFKVGKYPNIWHSQNNCEANITSYYSDSLNTDNCYLQTSDPNGYIIFESIPGDSLMKASSEYVLYANHKKRIQYLHENNGVYTAN